MNQEIRKLPKKTIIIISIMIIIALAIFLFLKDMKEQKLVEVFSTLEHKNVKEMQVINKMIV